MIKDKNIDILYNRKKYDIGRAEIRYHNQSVRVRNASKNNVSGGDESVGNSEDQKRGFDSKFRHRIRDSIRRSLERKLGSI